MSWELCRPFRFALVLVLGQLFLKEIEIKTSNKLKKKDQHKEYHFDQSTQSK
jgi:hypothetical protein